MKLKFIRNIFGKKRYEEIGYERFITETETYSFLNSFQPNEYHYKVIFYLLAYIGGRPCEIVKLKLQNFSKDFSYVTLNLNKTAIYGKGYDRRPVIKFVAEMVEDYVKLNISNILKHEGYLFYTDNPNSKHEFMQPSSLRWKLIEKRRLLGINDYIIHKKKHYRFVVYSLRHFFITEVVKKTGSVHIAMQIIGHTSPRTTMRYVEKLQSEEKLRILENVFSNAKSRLMLPAEQTRLTEITTA